MHVLGFHENRAQARALATALHGDYAEIDVHVFPDGESRVTVPTNLPHTAIFFRSLHNPNAKLIELLLAFEAAREHGCKRIILVAPYLCYMRQDMAFQPGQAVSQRILGKWLSHWVDDLITVDPHLHRIRHLSDALPHCHCVAESAAPLLGEFLRQRTDISSAQGLLVGPDEESEQWVKQVAHTCGLDFVIARKQRLGDRQVKIALPAYNYQNRIAILVDDVISSGKTLMETALALKAAGIAGVDALCTHALLADGAESGLQQAGIRHLYSSNAIPHASNCIDLTPVLMQGLRTRLGKQP